MDAKIVHLLSLAFSLFFVSRAAFTPQDDYLILCGSSMSNVTIDNRYFVGDASKNGKKFLSEGKSVSLSHPNPSSNSSVLYTTARVFTSASTYVFDIKKTGTHFVRLQFSPFSSEDYDLRNANFGVSANGFSLLGDFGANYTVLKEFILMIDKTKLEILFTPVDASGFAFVNGIEVFSAPKDFFIDAGGITLIGPNGVQEFSQNISLQILESVHRINVGGLKLTPFNDTLWRSWVSDEDFLLLKSAAKLARTSDPPLYQPGGATREIAPDSVYMTAQQMNVQNGNFMFNVTWDFPVSSSVVGMHFIRLHFCDIVSIALNTLYFNVYINGISAYKDLDLSTLASHQLASPCYIDFIVKSADNLDSIKISIGPSDLSNSLRKNAILNGVEIMKIRNFVSPPRKSMKKSNWVLVGSVAGGCFALSLAILAVLVMLKRIKRKSKPKPGCTESTGWTPLRFYGGSTHGTLSERTALSSPGANGYYSLKIPFGDIQFATNNFDKDLIIGSGGFGTVYRGTLRDNTKVAVKRGVPGSRQGIPEFQTEITVLSKIRHRHLVSLVGYCEEQSEMLLVYEYMEKGTLRSHLYGSVQSPLSWKQRLEMCIGAARGLHYLHTGSARGIIHRDIKSTNILLDENYIAKVADFGLSRSGPCLDETHVSTALKGSFGYIDPEYFRRQQLTDKSDVYSFGVVLCEVLCARPAVDPLLEREEVNLAEWAVERLKKGMVEQIVDPHLRGHIEPNSLKIFGETTEKCLAEYGVDRPTMGDVLWNLEHALRVLVNRRPREYIEEITVAASDDIALAGAIPAAPSSCHTHRVGEDGASDISTTRVFSQLINSEGR